MGRGYEGGKGGMKGEEGENEGGRKEEREDI